MGRKAVADAGVDWSEVSAVGIACGGPLDAERGLVLAPPHLPGWSDVPVTALAEQAFGRPAALDNDGTAGSTRRAAWALPPRSSAAGARPRTAVRPRYTPTTY